MNTARILAQAAQHAVSATGRPTVVADGGIENVNDEIDTLIGSGLFSRVLAPAGGQFLKFAHRGVVAIPQTPVALLA